MTDFTWDISFQLTGTFLTAGFVATPNVTATVTGTIVTDSDSGILQQSDFVSYSFIYSAPEVGFSGSASSSPGDNFLSLVGNIFSASGDTLSYVFDPVAPLGAYAFFGAGPGDPSQVAFGIDLAFHDFVQGDIRLQDAFFDQLDGAVTQPFQIGMEVVATLADISVIGTSDTTEDFSSISNVSGDVTISDNDQLVSIDFINLQSVGGNVTVTGNTSATDINFISLGSVGGDLTVTGDTSATDIDFASLDTTGGDVTIDSGADATLDASLLGPGGGTVDLIGDNLTTTITLGSLDHLGGTLTISSADGVTLTSHAGLSEFDITGTSADNTLIGSATANNVIDGGTGNDLMTGGAADDTFVFDFSVSQETVQHHDFVSLADITSVTIGDSIYFKPAPTGSITAWQVWDNALTTYANSQTDNTGGDDFTAFTNSNPAAKNVGTIQLIDGYFHDYNTTMTDIAASGFDTITNFANQALTAANGGGGNDVFVFNGLSTDQTAANYWGNCLSSTTENGNTTIHIHDVLNNGADVSAITLDGVTTDVATLVNDHIIMFSPVTDWHV